ncbi:MAG: nicotinate-nucleotide adenylyltransferase [Solirubrobacteraceae bacterium]|jgi:nicotinate-nucleotide adenylyltransferase|nr:nicotinate-nucleotide adenylyltransferase [Solirubrobacteraceae bacterium]
MGHLVCAQQAHAQLGLDVVTFVPVGTPPHKEAAKDPGREVRLRLCELATAGDDRFSVDRIEIDRPGPSYTIDTLTAVHEREPRQELILILGGDMAQTLGDWREPERIVSLARMGVAERAGAARDQIARGMDSLGAGHRIDFFDMPRIDISSSLVRELVARGEPIRYLVPDAVARYVAEHGLYARAA